jgi:hypothetical protein
MFWREGLKSMKRIREGGKWERNDDRTNEMNTKGLQEK